MGLISRAGWQVTGEDVDEVKRTAKQQIRAVLERDRDPLSGEWIIAYLRPLTSDPASKGARKVGGRVAGALCRFPPC